MPGPVVREDTPTESGDQEEDFQAYQYKSLPNYRSIRLLILHSASKKDQEVSCELITKDLDVEPFDNQAHLEYEALSWSWGTAPADRKIKIREAEETHFLNVKPSLVHALVALRRKRRMRTIWVDAVCI